MPDESVPPCILSEDDFKAGTGTWLEQVVQAGSQPALLDTIFSATSAPDPDSRIPYFAMPADWLRWLTSTVGCTEVKVRFLVSKSGQFALCFYATDAQNKRVSAYYLLNSDTTNLATLLATMYGQGGGSQPVTADDSSGAVQIPHGVAGHWIKNWQKADTLTPAMFTTQYGILQGYNFKRDDFADNLFNIKPAELQQLRVDFGLHKYYAHGDSDKPQATYTFGLVLRLVNPDDTTSDTPFYDMSTPCPPGY